MKTEKEQVKECGFEIICAMHDGVPEGKLFENLIKKYDSDILMKALEMVDKFQHWQAKRRGINLDDEIQKKFGDKELGDYKDMMKRETTSNIGVFEPELEFYCGSIVKDKNNEI